MAVQGSPTPPLARSGAIPTKTMHYVYVLKSGKDCKYYIGSSGDLKRRKEEHDRGLVASTRHRRPFDLLYYEAYPTKELAEERERNLKQFGSAYGALLKRLREK